MKYYPHTGPPARLRLLPVFIFGVTVGVMLSLLASNSFKVMYSDSGPSGILPEMLKLRNVRRLPNGPHRTDGDDSNDWPLSPFEVSALAKHDHVETYSHSLYERVRVLCWIMTSPSSHEKKAQHVKSTWGKRCNTLLFMSSTADESLPTVALKIDKEDRDHLWQKTKLAFEYVHKNYREEADWFVKADDDTYMVVENLRYMLAPYNTSQPIFFGHKYRMHVKQGYMSGGSGYVLSKEALDRFAKRNATICRADGGGAEDLEMGKCLEALGVTAGNSRDSHGGERFLPLDPGFFLTDEKDPKFWFWQYTYYAQNKGAKSVSDSFVSFHYVNPATMHVLDFMLYHARPYGLLSWFQENETARIDTTLPTSDASTTSKSR